MTNPLLKKLENAGHDGINWLKSEFTSSEQEAVKLATSAAHYVEQNGGQVLRDAASAAVIAAETTAGGGVAKAAAAFTQIVGVLTKEGLPVVTAAVNLAIEMALADAKEAGLINQSTPTAA